MIIYAYVGWVDEDGTPWVYLTRDQVEAEQGIIRASGRALFRSSTAEDRAMRALDVACGENRDMLHSRRVVSQ